ncbi:MAG: hypothetical protein EPO64_05095 [Nitrospirae bacterium]|nr:MAG: hypothetical protein EPO64_05095 [Nitrospirota bacterium]
MKMLLLVFRQSLEQDLLLLLKELDVKAFTEAPKVFGMGEAGTAYQSLGWPGSNSMILAAMEEEQAERVVQRLKLFREHLAQQQHGAKIPMRLFAIPCEHLV